MNTNLFLRIIAAILAVFGLIYLISPITLATKAGITADNSGLTDIRATYGGIQIGLAVFLYWSSLARERIPSALAATAIIFFFVGACRFYGVIVDGELSGFNLIGLSFEIVLTIISSWLYLRINKAK
jgi:peptidoglycan/LPS O-acetylase OafA/YrhL